MAEVKLKKVTIAPKHRKFANALLEGKSKIDAYMEFIDPDVDSSQALIKANNVLKGQRVREYLEEKKQLLTDKTIDKQLWERQNSIFFLKHVINTNLTAQEQVAEAIDDEIDFIIHTMQENPDDKKLQETCVKQIIKKRQKLRVNRTTNDAVLIAVAELNKMHGFNEENVNLYQGSVVFTGADELED